MSGPSKTELAEIQARVAEIKARQAKDEQPAAGADNAQERKTLDLRDL